MHADQPSTGLTLRQSLLVGSLMFGLFFGAGNLIFPASLGLQGGHAWLIAALGFLITAVGLPILGVIASALAHTASLHELTSRVGPRFAVFFTCALYLTIGPLFAIPRTATVSFEMAFGRALDGPAKTAALVVFSAAFFAVALWAALRPGKLLDYVGRYLTPLFLILLTVLLVVVLSRPMPAPAAPIGDYATQAGVQGILDGYNTMDALASLAFAIVIVEAVRQLGVTSPRRIALEVGRAGIWAALAMGLIYVALAALGASAITLVPRDANGAVTLSATASSMFGPVGHVLASAIMLVACLKTAIGLVTACVEMFADMFPRALSRRGWALVFAGVSFALANVGLTTIIKAAVPVLSFLYPLAIGLIVLGLLDPWVRSKPWTYRLTMLFIGLASLVALIASLPDVVGGLPAAAAAIGGLLPGFDLGFGWIIPGVIGLVAGLVLPSSSPAPVESA